MTVERVFLLEGLLALCAVSCSDGDQWHDSGDRPDRPSVARERARPRPSGGSRPEPPALSGAETGPAADAAPDSTEGGLVDAGTVDAPAPRDASGSRDAALDSDAPVYRFDVRVHAKDTRMDRPTLTSVLDETQLIWALQARVCFEFHTVLHDEEHGTGFDVWYVPESPDLPESNGFIDGRRILVRDQPKLAPAAKPVMYPAARTTAHELGHGLGLDHYTDPIDLSESLMASKQAGYRLHTFEVDIARRVARTFGAEVTPDYRCAPVRHEASAEH